MLCAWRRYKAKYHAVSTVAILIEGSESLSKTARSASIFEAVICAAVGWDAVEDSLARRGEGRAG